MQITLLHHPKDGYNIDLSRLIDLTQVFKVRDTENWDRDFCVYAFEDENHVVQYIGMGRYYDITTNKWLKSRPFTHRQDLLASAIKPSWTCRIVALGLTSKEAHVLEAYMILSSNRKLTKIGANKWNKETLINKKRELKWEGMINEYLNNGNYTRITA